jgi:hypothetical protein
MKNVVEDSLLTSYALFSLINGTANYVSYKASEGKLSKNFESITITRASNFSNCITIPDEIRKHVDIIRKKLILIIFVI